MEPLPQKTGLSAAKVFAIVFCAMLLALLVAFLVIKSWLFPGPFTPVQLSQAEEQRLERKLARFEHWGNDAQPLPQANTHITDADLTPEPYSEVGASHEIHLSEREINGLIAQNTDLARRLVVDFSQDLISVKLLIPVDPDFPIMGGKVLKVRAGAEMAYRQGRPVVILRGISIMGVPLPNAWLGGLKNIDLIETFGTDPGFWKSFADGVAAIDVGDGSLRIVLRE
nr:arginine N-succinyltransferase [uncultured Desulfobulbus sp.]